MLGPILSLPCSSATIRQLRLSATTSDRPVLPLVVWSLRLPCTQSGLVDFDADRRISKREQHGFADGLAEPADRGDGGYGSIPEFEAGVNPPRFIGKTFDVFPCCRVTVISPY